MPNDVLKIMDRIRGEISKVIVGQEEGITMLQVGLLAGGHVLLEGVPGLAKTLLAKTMAKVIRARFTRIQFTPDLMPADILGTNVFDLQSRTFRLRKGPIFTEILLADEINRTPPKTQSALLEAMEEKQVSIDGETHPCRNSSWSWQPRTPSSRKARTPFPRRSWIVSS